MEVLSQLRLPTVKSSCCGCSLQLGATLIALVHVFLYGGAFLTVFILICIDDYKWYQRHHYTYETFSNAYVRDEFALALVVGTVFYSGTLYYGIKKKEKMLFIPWLFLKAMLLIFNSLNIFQMSYDRISIGYKSLEVFILLAYCGLDAYQTTIVYSFYNELKMRDGEYD